MKPSGAGNLCGVVAGLIHHQLNHDDTLHRGGGALAELEYHPFQQTLCYVESLERVEPGFVAMAVPLLVEVEEPVANVEIVAGAGPAGRAADERDTERDWRRIWNEIRARQPAVVEPEQTDLT